MMPVGVVYVYCGSYFKRRGRGNAAGGRVLIEFPRSFGKQHVFRSFKSEDVESITHNSYQSLSFGANLLNKELSNIENMRACNVRFIVSDKVVYKQVNRKMKTRRESLKMMRAVVAKEIAILESHEKVKNVSVMWKADVKKKIESVAWITSDFFDLITF